MHLVYFVLFIFLRRIVNTLQWQTIYFWRLRSSDITEGETCRLYIGDFPGPCEQLHEWTNSNKIKCAGNITYSFYMELVYVDILKQKFYNGYYEANQVIKTLLNYAMPKNSYKRQRLCKNMLIRNRVSIASQWRIFNQSHKESWNRHNTSPSRQQKKWQKTIKRLYRRNLQPCPVIIITRKDMTHSVMSIDSI